MECLLCGAEIFNPHQLFCKQCKKDYHKDYLAVCKNIKNGEYNRKDADNIKKLIEEKFNKQKIEDKLNIPKGKLNWIVKYFYPDYEITYTSGKKTNNNIKPIQRITKENIKDEVKKLNKYGLCGTDISLITRITYGKLGKFDITFNGPNKDLYPFAYQNIYDEWFYFTYVGTKKIFLMASDKETLMQQIEEKGFDAPRFLQ